MRRLPRGSGLRKRRRCEHKPEAWGGKEGIIEATHPRDDGRSDAEVRCVPSVDGEC